MDSRVRLDRLRGLLLERASQVAKQAGDTDCVRLCAGLADGLPGMLVDQFGPLAVAVDYSGPPEPGPGAEGLLQVVRECRPGRSPDKSGRKTTIPGEAFVIGYEGPNRWWTCRWFLRNDRVPMNRQTEQTEELKTGDIR